MKILDACVLVVLLGVLVFALMQYRRHEDRAIAKVEAQYMECLGRNDAQSCALEQLMLRGLTCKS